MKIAVIIIGRIEEQYQQLNLQLLQGCDIFIHSDIENQQLALQYNPKFLKLTDSTYLNQTVELFIEQYSYLIDKVREETDQEKPFRHNFERIVQWKRLNEVLIENKFEEYDYILKWRVDLNKFNIDTELSEIIKKYKTVKNYISSIELNKSCIYTYKDFLFLFVPSKSYAVDVYNNIEDYIGVKEDKFTYDIDILEQCDTEGKFKCANFTWLTPKNKLFSHVFTSETAMIIHCLVNKVPLKNIFKGLYS